MHLICAIDYGAPKPGETDAEADMSGPTKRQYNKPVLRRLGLLRRLTRYTF